MVDVEQLTHQLALAASETDVLKSGVCHRITSTLILALGTRLEISTRGSILRTPRCRMADWANRKHNARRTNRSTTRGRRDR